MLAARVFSRSCMFRNRERTMEVQIMICVPWRRGKVVDQINKVTKEQAPVRTVNGGRLTRLHNGWSVFQAWTGSIMVLIPPRKPGQSEQSWKRGFCRGSWKGSGVWEKCVWNRGRDWHGVRMLLEDLSVKNRQALRACGLRFFRTVYIGCQAFICEEQEV